mgnify:CR=1 FL=1
MNNGAPDAAVSAELCEAIHPGAMILVTLVGQDK